MTQVKVIITKRSVFTTFYKTVHFHEDYNEPNLRRAEAKAFRLATTTPNPACELLDFKRNAAIQSIDDVFAYLNKCHS